MIRNGSLPSKRNDLYQEMIGGRGHAQTQLTDLGSTCPFTRRQVMPRINVKIMAF